MFSDWLVTGQLLAYNPAAAVRGPKGVAKKGNTQVLTAGEACRFFDSIEITTVNGLRDRALIALMVYSFARIGAVVGMKGDDYYQNGIRRWFRLHEKCGNFHEVPAHHNADAYLHEYIEAAGIAGNRKAPSFARPPVAPARSPTVPYAAITPSTWSIAVSRRRAFSTGFAITLPGYRHHHVSRERWHDRKDPADRRP
jgi:integrase